MNLDCVYSHLLQLFLTILLIINTGCFGETHSSSSNNELELMETTDLMTPQHKHYLRHVRHKTHHYDQLLNTEKGVNMHHKKHHRRKHKKRRSLSATAITTIEADTSTVPFRIQNSKEGIRRTKPRHLMLTKPYWPWP